MSDDISQEGSPMPDEHEDNTEKNNDIDASNDENDEEHDYFADSEDENTEENDDVDASEDENDESEDDDDEGDDDDEDDDDDLDESEDENDESLESPKTPDHTEITDSMPAPPSAGDADGDNLTQTAGLLRDVPSPVIVELGRINLNALQIARLKEGQVLRLPRGIQDPVDLIVEGKVFAKAELVEIEDELGVRLLRLQSSNNS